MFESAFLAVTCFMVGAELAPLHDALLALPFSNYDITRKIHNFSMRSVSSIYLESEVPLKARWAWADGRITPFHAHSYLFVANATANQTTGGVSYPSSNDIGCAREGSGDQDNVPPPPLSDLSALSGLSLEAAPC